MATPSWMQKTRDTHGAPFPLPQCRAHRAFLYCDDDEREESSGSTTRLAALRYFVNLKRHDLYRQEQQASVKSREAMEAATADEQMKTALDFFTTRPPLHRLVLFHIGVRGAAAAAETSHREYISLHASWRYTT